ncbi:MAG: glycoside hydrolase family 32 protein [Candidatus Nanopelagicaceae bacterium]
MRERPKKHFTPKANWINDPNGLIYHAGQYHLFFQHNPLENKWGHMSWGHAVSEDLINWRELPVAIPEQVDHAIFSGSAIFDEENNRLVAIYSGHKEGNQSQYLAFSYDGGITWRDNTKVLDLKMADFRDPKVFRYKDKWVMSVAKSKELKISFFESTDLFNWKFLSDFSAPDIWDLYECPDLFELDGKWILIISTNPGGLHGGSGSRYLIGDFDGNTFTPESSAKFLDYGPDYYAAVTFNDASERISIGWMNNWEYANQRELETWNGSMTSARKLQLKDGKLVQSFIGESKTIKIDADQFEFLYKNGALKFKRDGEKLNIDRSELWDSNINSFTVPAVGDLEITALFDAGSIELLVNGHMATALLQVGQEEPVLRSK